VDVAALSELENPEQNTIESESIHFEHASILIVDDVEANRNLVKEYLEDVDFTFYEATNGEEALELVKLYSPDLILMDMKMPILDGYEATKRLKDDEKSKIIPVIALTASAMKDAEKKFLKICDGYLRKPVSQSQLMEELACFLKHTVKKVEAVPLPFESEEKEEPYIPDPETLGKLPELLVLLEKRLVKWETMTQVMIISQIEEFANQVQDWGTTYHCPPLIKWGKTLHHQASEFDAEALRKTLNHFPQLIENIRTLLS